MALIATRLDAKIFLVVTPPPFSPSPYQYLTISPDNLKTSQTQNRMLALFTTPTTVGTTLATAWEWREGGGGGGGGGGGRGVHTLLLAFRRVAHTCTCMDGLTY